MKELPKYFVIKRDESNPRWKKYIDWLNKTYGCSWDGDCYIYYGYDGNSNCTDNYRTDCHHIIENFQNSPTLITLEEWDECVNGFVLPEKWFIKLTEENIQSVFEWGHIGGSGMIKVGHFVSSEPSWNDKDTFTIKGYTEITYSQFKKYVIKENNMEEKKQNRTITAQQAQSIIDIAQANCSWKSRLARLWGAEIALKRNIEIIEDFYKEMRSACTSPQHKLFDEIFGKDEKEFRVEDIKVGEHFITKCGGEYLKCCDGRMFNIHNGKIYLNMMNEIVKKVVIKSIEWEEVK